MQDSGPSLALASKLSNPVKDYVRPDKACSHCRMWQLDCIINQSNAQSCYPCKLLSRECNVVWIPKTAVLMDGTMPSPELGTADPTLGHHTLVIATGSVNTAEQSSTPAKALKSNQRFQSAQIKTLKAWLRDHKDHPYPSKDDSLELQEKTGLNVGQIATWFANCRRRLKAREPSQLVSQSTSQSTPVNVQPVAFQSCDPLERWKNSPPEMEPAALEAVAAALNNVELDNQLGNYHSGETSSFFDSQSEGQASSERSTESLLSMTSQDCRRSAPSSTSSRSGAMKLRSRRRRKIHSSLTQTGDVAKKRKYQCTFCTDGFNTKHDWTRHERTLHLSLETWTCPGTAKQVQDSMTTDVICAFCDLADPSTEHIDDHNPHAFHTANCGSYEPRHFYRKDHLKQHLRLAHGVRKVSSHIERYWHEVRVNIRSRCGFCDEHFTTWSDRAAHLAQEFREGADMKNWKGSRGLDAAIEARVTFSMAPYLIDHERRSQSPFSASNPASILRYRDLIQNSGGAPTGQTTTTTTNDWDFQELIQSDVATYWETFPVKLGQWAQQKMTEGSCLTDEMLQAQGRFIVFGDDDPWNQTEADHPDWLAEFKRVNGIGMPVNSSTLESTTLNAPTTIVDEQSTDRPNAGNFHLSPVGVLDPAFGKEQLDDLQQDWTTQLHQDWSTFDLNTLYDMDAMFD